MKTRLLIMTVLFAMLGFAAYAADLRTVVINGQSMVSLRTFGDTFDATIDYDSDRDGISISLDDRTVDLIPYSRIAWIDGREVTLPAPVVIIDDETYIPVRFMCEAFGLDYQCTRYNQVTIINPHTLFRVVLVVDLDWGRVTHRWRRDFDCRDYRNYRVTVIHRDTPPRDRDDRWDRDRRLPARDDARDHYYRPQPWRDNVGPGRIPVKPTTRPNDERPGQWGQRPDAGRPWGWNRNNMNRPSYGRDPKTENGRQGRWNQDGRDTRSGGWDRNGRDGRRTAPESRAGDARQGRQQKETRDSNGRDRGRDRRN